MKEILSKNKQNIAFGIISIIIFALFILSFMWPFDFEEETKDTDEIVETPKEENKTVLVDIKGQIQNPGVYKMDSNQRIIDVIKKAGNLTSIADTSMINLSQKVKDEMVIIIYSKKEVEEMNKEEPCICPENNDACINEENKNETITKDDSKTNETKTNTKISINNSTKEELMTLDGIGESKAKSIIDYRTENGNFEKIEDIKEVSGIGDALYEKIKNKITI